MTKPERNPVAATATLAPPATDIRLKFHKLSDVLQAQMIERTSVIDSAMLALIGRMHLFMLGVPGVAKSRLVDLLFSHIDGLTRHDRYKTLMTRYSVPEEVFGPVSLSMLKQDRYVFMTDGYFPTARIAFLDEIWNANSAILNALLLALNEREFRNDGQMGTIPLHSMFCASNNLPESDELNAINDRIQFRHVVRPIQGQADFIQMLKLRWAKTNGPVISWAEIELAHQASQMVVVPDEVLEAVNTVRMKLRKEGVQPTDRKFVDSIGIVQAKAWLDGKDTAEIEHLVALSNVLWTTPDQHPIVESVLLTLASPLDKAATDILVTLDQMTSETDRLLGDTTIDPVTKNAEAIELHTALDRVKDDLKKVMAEVKKSGRKSVRTDEARAKLRALSERLLKEMFIVGSKDIDLGI